MFQIGVVKASGGLRYCPGTRRVLLVAELPSDLESFLHLCGSIGEDVHIGTGSGAALAMKRGLEKRLAGVPEQLHAGHFWQLFNVGGH